MVAAPETKPPLIHRAALRPGFPLACAIWGLAAFNSFVPLYATRNLGLPGARTVLLANALTILDAAAVRREAPGPHRAAASGADGADLQSARPWRSWALWATVPGLVRRCRPLRRRPVVRVPVAHDDRGEQRAGDRARLGHGDVHRVLRPVVRRWCDRPRGGRERGRLQRRVPRRRWASRSSGRHRSSSRRRRRSPVEVRGDPIVAIEPPGE